MRFWRIFRPAEGGRSRKARTCPDLRNNPTGESMGGQTGDPVADDKATESRDRRMWFRWAVRRSRVEARARGRAPHRP